MRLPPRAVRRLLIDPLWVPVALVLVVVAGAAALLGLLLLPVFRSGRLMRFAALAGAYLVLDLVLLLASFLLWCRHPLARRRGDAWVASHVAVLRWALSVLIRAAGRTIGFRVLLEDEPADDVDAPLLILARHAGPGDSFTLVWLVLERFHRCPRVVMKEALQWDPGLDVVLNRLASCFLPSRTGAGDDATGMIEEAARSLRGRDALLLFPEGANWTPKRQRRATRRLRRTGLRRAADRAAAHPNVLPPRPGGSAACLGARPDLDAVVVAHTGLDRLVTPRQMWDAVPLTTPMTIALRRVPSTAIPRQPSEVQGWLEQEWDDLSDWVAARTAAEATGRGPDG